jgi:hypothetical protein
MRSADEIRARAIGLGTGTHADLGGAVRPADGVSARRVIAALEDRPFFGPLHVACEPDAALRAAADVGATLRAEIDSEAISGGLREVHVARLAAVYGFDVEERLSAILPGVPEGMSGVKSPHEGG